MYGKKGGGVKGSGMWEVGEMEKMRGIRGLRRVGLRAEVMNLGGLELNFRWISSGSNLFGKSKLQS